MVIYKLRITVVVLDCLMSYAFNNLRKSFQQLDNRIQSPGNITSKLQ